MAEVPPPAPTTSDAAGSSSAPAIATTKYVTAADVKWFVGTMVAVAAFSVGTAFALDGRADDKVARSEHRTNKRIDGLEKTTERQDVKLDAMLFAFGVPNPAPAPPKDGGP